MPKERVCDTGMQCGHFGMANSSEWNNFEVERVSPRVFINCEFRRRPVKLCAVFTASSMNQTFDPPQIVMGSSEGALANGGNII